MISGLALSKLIIMIQSLLLGIFVIQRNPERQTHRLFLASMLMFSAHAFVEFQLKTSSSVPEFLAWKNWEFFAYLGIAFMFHFAFIYSRDALNRRFEKIWFPVYTVSIIAVLVNAFVTRPINAVPKPWGFEPVYSPRNVEINTILAAIFSIIALAALIICILAFLRIKDHHQKIQIGIFTAGFAVLVLSGAIFELILPFVLHRQTHQSATSAFLVVNFIFAYGLWRYDFLSLPSLDISRELFKILNDGLAFTDSQDFIRYANDAFSQMTGYSIHELSGMPLMQLIHSPESPNSSAPHVPPSTSQTGPVIDLESILTDRHGEKIPVSISISIYQSRFRNGQGRIYLFRNISARKRIEDLNKTLERMMRHDLRLPLNGIIQLPDLLMDNPGMEPEQQELILLISKLSLQMRDQIESYLSIQSIEDGTFQYYSAQYDIAAVIREVVFSLSGKTEDKGITCNVMLNENPILPETRHFHRTDRTLLFCIISNLLANALEASPKNQTVTITVETNPQLQIKIHNVGRIPREIEHHIFEKFVTAEKPYGTGLGAYSAHLMTEAMGGSIAAETDDQHGTTITVQL